LGTPKCYLKTALAQVAMVMTAMSEGVSIGAATRIFGHHPTTIQRWVERAGEHSRRLHERICFRALAPGHAQFDELVAWVKRASSRVWVWTGIDAASKLIFALHIGGRTSADACQFIHQVWQRLAPGCWPVFTSDGLNQYFHGLTAHFGAWVKPPRARKLHWIPDPRLLYAQLRKIRRGRRVIAIDHLVRLGNFSLMLIMLCALGFSGLVQTAFIERANLTYRALIAPRARRTWSIAHDLPHLWLHVQWGLAYYNFARPHQSLRIRVRGPSRWRHRTPAMAAGLVPKPWSVTDILLLPIPEDCWLAPFPAA
jgi:IS1 family transposase